MKQYLLLLSILLVACNTQQSKYPNITTDLLLSDLKWGSDSAFVFNLLTQKYKLHFVEEFQQISPKRAFVFSGGRFNDIEPNKWTALFVENGLFFVQIIISNDQQTELKQSIKKLSEQNDKYLTRDSTSAPSQNRWYYQKDGRRISNILVSDFASQKSLSILISRGDLEN